MDIFKSKPLKLASAAFYIVLMFLSFYCACYRLPVGLKYAINLLCVELADSHFLSQRVNPVVKVFLYLFFLFPKRNIFTFSRRGLVGRY